MELAKNGMMTQAILNVAANVVLCLAATAIGVWLAKGS
jgi:fluoride ion exporter CrcB/FEX